jgi:hypothetical protein
MQYLLQPKNKKNQDSFCELSILRGFPPFLASIKFKTAEIGVLSNCSFSNQ